MSKSAIVKSPQDEQLIEVEPTWCAKYGDYVKLTVFLLLLGSEFIYFFTQTTKGSLQFASWYKYSFDHLQSVIRKETYTNIRNQKIAWEYISDEPKNVVLARFFYTNGFRKQHRHLVLFDPNPRKLLEYFEEEGILEAFRRNGYLPYVIRTPLGKNLNFDNLQSAEYVSFLEHVFREIGVSDVLDQTTVIISGKQSCSMFPFLHYHRLERVIALNPDKCTESFFHITTPILWVTNTDSFPPSYLDDTTIRHIDVEDQLPANAKHLKNWMFSVKDYFINLLDQILLKDEAEIENVDISRGIRM